MLVRNPPDVALERTDETRPAPWYDGAPIVEPPNEDLRRYMSALYRRRWAVLAVMALCLAVAAAYLRLATPIYEARTKLLIDSQAPNVVSFKEVVEQNTAKLDYYETQVGILRSRTLARTTLTRLKLWDHPEFAERPSVLRRGVPGRVLARILPSHGAAPAARSSDETLSQSRVIDAFLSRLNITYRAGNRLFDVSFRSADPRLAADVPNTVADAFIAQNLDVRLHSAKDASDWLNARLAEQRGQVEASELLLQRYREQNADVSLSEQQNIIVRKLAELSTAATTAKAERLDAEARYAQLQKVQRDPSKSDELPILLTSSYIQQLKTELAELQRDQARLAERYGELHPEMRRVNAEIARVDTQIRSEVAKAAASVRHDVEAKSAKERSLTAAVSEQERLALALDRRGIQYSALQREVASNREMYQMLLDRAKQTEISSELRVTNMQVIDPAEVPGRPASPQAGLILALAALLGLPLGVGGALGVEYLDDRIRSADEIRQGLGLRFLGFTPAVPWRLAKSGLSLVNRPTQPEFAEALRMVRGNLLLCAPAHGSKSLVITSTGPGEGKTVVAANLAIALAQAGRRVLLVDADLRRCQVHEFFKAPLEPGLSSVLDGRLPIADAIRPSGVSGLSLLTTGVTNGASIDLLEAPGITGVIASVRDHFEWIVIDSPPVMAGSDAASLAQAATGVVFVVGAKMTSSRQARAALEQLQDTHATILGAVLSRSSDTHYAKYYTRES